MQNVPYAIAVLSICVHLFLSSCVKLAKDITSFHHSVVLTLSALRGNILMGSVKVITNRSSYMTLQLQVQDKKRGGGLYLFQP